MRIIPAIDIIDGNCVRAPFDSKGDYNHTKKIYKEPPVEVARVLRAFNGIEYNLQNLVDLERC